MRSGFPARSLQSTDMPEMITYIDNPTGKQCELLVSEDEIGSFTCQDVW